MTHSFCDSCNRVRITCSGRMYLCLGNETAADLGKALRDSDDDRDVAAAIREAVARKPKGHAFGSSAARAPRASGRPISLTGG
jgi:cyclic pyranopterin phosphate synthase